MNTENLNPEQQDQLLCMMLIQQHQQIAMMGLGKLQNPATGEMDRDLSSAKYAIDTLKMLEKYTKGNIPQELKGFLEQTLNTLRLNYADESKKGKIQLLLKRRMKVKDIEAGGGVVFRRTEIGIEVLLIYRNGVWDIPKGKREKNETREECATREVMEEVNADALPKITYTLDSTFHSYEQKNKQYNKTTFWYTMIFETVQEFAPEVSEGIEKVEWVELQEAKEKVGYKNLVQVLDEFETKLNSEA